MKTIGIAPWMIRSSVLAMGVAIVAFGAGSPVSSQPFNGSGIVTAGQADITNAGNSGSVVINGGFGGSAVINWTPSDTATGGGPINFQNASTVMTFRRDDNADFAVLNRIIPTDISRPVQFNGTVLGRVNGVSSGGTVYFYSPGGIVLGNGAFFDVGRLGLTTADPYNGSSSDFVNGDGSVNFGFGGPAAGGSAIRIDPGATINAPVDGYSYVALFAPNIQQNGTVNVNGSAAYVAGAAGTLRWRDGLFDVIVDVGTDGDGTGVAITHGGTTNLRSNSSIGQYLRAYMVAVPQNNAITALVSGGGLGFDVANSAVVVDNAVILSAGFEQTGDTLTPARSPVTPAGGNISVSNANITSEARLVATGDARVEASGGMTSIFNETLLIDGQVQAGLYANGGFVTLNGDNLIVRNSLFDPRIRPDVTSGAANIISANGGVVTLNGAVDMISSAYLSSASGRATDIKAGTVRLAALDGGQIIANSDVTMRANSSGFGGLPTDAREGGTVIIQASGGNSLLTISGDLIAEAMGRGASADGMTTVNGGAGTGGSIEVFSELGSGNRLTFDAATRFDASGHGGNAYDGMAGAGQGGSVLVSARDGSTFEFKSTLDMDVTAESGRDDGPTSGGQGAGATGGIATIETLGAASSVTVSDALTMDGTANAFSIASSIGGLAKGGDLAIKASRGNMTLDGAVRMTSNATGGAGLSNNSGTGGTIDVLADISGTLMINNGVNLFAVGRGALGSNLGTTGTGTGGEIRLANNGTGSITVLGEFAANADGYGGLGYSLNPGEGFGRLARIIQNGSGDINFGASVTLTANGVGADAGNETSFPLTATGGTGQGGTASIALNGTGNITITGQASVQAVGNGGQGLSGFVGDIGGGLGQGGLASVVAGGVGASGTISFTSALDVAAFGTGGSGADGAGGVGQGGVASVQALAGGTISTATPSSGFAILMNAGGEGGSTIGMGIGGDGLSGSARLASLSGGTLSLGGDVLLGAQAKGGSGLNGGNADGRIAPTSPLGQSSPLTVDAFSPSVQLFNGGGTITLTGTLTMNASSEGGSATRVFGIGGNAFGGTAGIVTASGEAASTTLGTVAVSVNGLGGRGGFGSAPSTSSPNALSGGNGGNAFGGLAQISGFAGGGYISGPSGLLTTGDIIVDATSRGGNGGNGETTFFTGASGGNGGVGGNAVGGIVRVGANSIAGASSTGGANFGNVTIDISANGGNGGAGGTGGSGTPAGADGIGGAGGEAIGSTGSRVFAYGGFATMGDVSMTGTATGGFGGGSTGAGGNATAGSAELVITGRSGTGERGFLNAGAITGTFEAVAGAGATTGASYYSSGPVVSVTDGDAILNGLNLHVIAGGPSGALPVSAARLLLVNGSVTASDRFEIITPGEMSVHLDGGLLTATDLSLNVGNFVTDPLGALPAAPGTLSGNTVNIISGLDILLGANVESTESPLTLVASGAISVGDLFSQSDLFVTAGTSLSIRDLNAGGLISLDAPGVIALRNVNDAVDVEIDGGRLTAGFINASGGVRIDSVQDIVIGGRVTAIEGFVDLTSGGDLSVGQVSGGSEVSFSAPGNIVTGNVESGGFLGFFTGAGTVTAGDLDVLDSISIDTQGAISVGAVSAGGSVTFNSMSDVAASRIDAGDTVSVNGFNVFIPGAVTAGIVNPSSGEAFYGVGIGALGSLLVGDVNAANVAILFAQSGGLTAGTVRGGSDVAILAHGDVLLGGIETDASFGRTILIGDSSTIPGGVGGDVDLEEFFSRSPNRLEGNLTVTGAISGGRIDIQSRFDVTLADVIARNDIYIGAQNITTGNLTATGGDINLTAMTDIPPSEPEGPLELAGTMAFASPMAAGGNIFVGNLSANQITLSPTGDLVLGSAQATTSIGIIATGKLSIAGLVAAPLISLNSSDIEIASGSRIDAGDDGLILIHNSNPNGMRIGDGPEAMGYVLDKAEFSTLNSGNVTITSTDNVAMPVDMVIGELNITGPLAGSTIDAPDGNVRISVVDSSFGRPSGTIRVNGAVRAVGFLPTNGLIFSSSIFEMDATTGSIELLGSGSALAGTLGFRASRIQVAQASILDKLAADPLYAGRDVDLNAPLATPRPNGVLRAGVIDFGITGAILIQNTGTTLLPAGFYTSDFRVDYERSPLADSFDLIVNGQLVRPTPATVTVVTGNAVRDILVDADTRVIATAPSSVNGCGVFTPVCATPQPPTEPEQPKPPEQPNPPTEPNPPEPPSTTDEAPAQILQSDNLIAVQSESSSNTPPMTDEERRQAEEEAERAPIAPPTPLISTAPLNPVIDVDEPVSGSGNPALIGGGSVNTVIGRGKR